MASSYTLNQGIEKPATGEQSGTWGATTNTNFDIIDRSLSGVGALSLTGTTTTLTTTDGSLTDGMYKVLVLGGSPSGTNTITLSDNTQDKFYFVVNASGQEVQFTQGTGANATISDGFADIIYADGAGGGAAVASLFATSLKLGNDLSLKSDSAVLGFGADLDTTLTHTDGTGLTLNSTNKLTFGDAATFINQSTNGQLDVDADVELELTAPTVDIAASTAVTIATPSLIISDNTTDEPIVQIKNTHNGTTAGELRFVMDKGSAGADGDDLGTISFYGDDSGQAQTAFASIVGEVSESANTDEAGKLSLFVAESDGTTTALAAGLVLEGEHATNGEVDVTIAAGTASTTTVAGSLVVTTDLDVDGTANLDVVDIDGAVDMATTLTVGTNLTITNGDIVFGTSGNGINLGVTSNTDANTLDDYEEGTYTVALTCGTSGSVALKSTNNTGRYTKIGRICHVNCDARIDSVSSPSGSMIFSLPFASANPASDEHATLGTMITHGTTKQSGQVGNFFPIVTINAASFNLTYENASTRLAVTHDNVGIGANDEFVFTLTYTTA